MFLVRFCTVVATEAVQTSCQFAEVVHYQVYSFRNYLRTKQIKKDLKKKMQHANSFAEWKIYAQEYDKLKDIQIWKETQESDQYDWEYIKHLTESLRESREKDEYLRVIHLIRSNAMRHLGNILNRPLYAMSYIGTKHLIEEFQQEMVVSLEYIATLPRSKLSRSKKLEFFAETRHAFGRTALVFSGGANLGRHHYGVIKCLYEEGLLPRIIAGSSVGSLFASFLCTRKYDKIEEMLNVSTINFSAFDKRNDKHSHFRKIRRLFAEGYLLDIGVIRDFVRDNIGDVTFQEAYDRTGWILNITATGYGEHDSYRLLNYLTAPNVVIWSAICASCALPHIFGPVDLYCKDENNQITLYIPAKKKFLDGSIAADIPSKLLSEMFNVNSFIVSQTNPWTIPFLNHSENWRHSSRATVYKVLEFIKDLVGSEVKHRINQLIYLGILPNTATRYFNLITQSYLGNITIFPKITFKDILSLMDNPKEEALRKGKEEGARRVYHKVNHIAATMVIERALEKNYLYVRSLAEKKVFLDEIEEADLDEKLKESRVILTNNSVEGDDEEPQASKAKRVASFRIPRSSSIDLLKNLAKTYVQVSGKSPLKD